MYVEHTSPLAKCRTISIFKKSPDENKSTPKVPTKIRSVEAQKYLVLFLFIQA